MMRRTTSALVLACALALAACGGGNEVGDDSLLQFDQEQAEQLASTSSTATSVAETTVTTGSTGTTAPQQATTTLPPDRQEVTIDVKINASSPYFNPSYAQVLVGSKVRFTNVDSVAHSVLSDIGAFDSGPIAPGGVWIYNATSSGKYNYSDGGRPFAVGLIEVQ